MTSCYYFLRAGRVSKMTLVLNTGIVYRPSDCGGQTVSCWVACADTRTDDKVTTSLLAVTAGARSSCFNGPEPIVS